MQSNILQYGRDQLDFASSEILSSFVSWYYWTCYLFPGIALLLIRVVFLQDLVVLTTPSAIGIVLVALV